jgi:cytosine/creatinine deaminase
MASEPGFQIAVAEAKAGLAEGGIPIGAALIAADGKVLGRGRNQRMQKGSPTLHVRTRASKFEVDY